jgi:ubiquinone/menaquinone biosynthesis C-methylase UbiE
VLLLVRVRKAIGSQLRNPSGATGFLLAHAMAVANRASNRIAIDALAVARHDKVLELGFGCGRAIKTLSALAPQGWVLGIDHSATMLAQAVRHNRRIMQEGRIFLLQCRIDGQPCRTDSIDKILAVHVVYFWGPAELYEARRVLRPGGSMVILATDRSAMVRWKFDQFSSHTFFDADQLSTLLMRGGFARSKIVVSQIKLSFGVPALLAIATK